MSNMPAAVGDISANTMASVLLDGDLSRLSDKDRVEYMVKVCQSLGLNPTTKPFEFIKLSGRLVMYAKRDCTEQLRKIHMVSLTIKAREVVNGCYVVTAGAESRGRCDESIGAVPIEGLKGESLSNAMMKAETKAKRRVTLSICGLGLLDETEAEPAAKQVQADAVRAEAGPQATSAEINAALVKEGLDPTIDQHEKQVAQDTFAEMKALGAAALKRAQLIKHNCGTDYAKMASELKVALREEIEGVAN